MRIHQSVQKCPARKNAGTYRKNTCSRGAGDDGIEQAGTCCRTQDQASSDNPEEGSTTVEYALGAIATAGFAGLLIAVLKSGAVQSAIEALITTALSL
jgi:hypothetical protein